MEKKQKWANSYHHTQAPSSGKLVETYFLQKGMSESLWMQKGWIICTSCSGSCDNSQVPSQDSDEGEAETKSVLEQTYDEIEEEEDYSEADNPIADEVEEIYICDV
ncbi:hypothetical protein JTB14_027585 [Gonioctena quinquepunctata]|nr:hypothetical protein JTB14_027585 [Gonioctena quinquepunctata]